ncbi:LytTR family DNA-binding domain-containing protein [Tenacibaculum sp. IB213877]|uniref:LytR/AlgR family response regulator transcription factor n=1 Tax=Tenacibaculum sp. IB213877 TaxID=3097351 RepID=UPI002A5A059C|nr:LytTR family DNA-binding domain-containing protein [Tenacibaculum sp. IB213877]MDY0780225.1 LytTR family DNA-binding domain-containing protein [Tenacibaculum sp. IB213877]
MIKYIIVDDETVAHDIIKEYCDMLPNLKFLKNCFNAIEAIDFLNNNTVDLIFLDLNMPKLKGFDFLKTLKNPPKVIVTTAYAEHAIEGYELNIVDYLLKPFSFERFLKAVNKINEKEKKQIKQVKNVDIDSLFIKSEKKIIQVKVDDILFVEALGNYCKIVTEESEFSIREKISEFKKILPDDFFIQVHKSFIIAKKHVNEIEGNRIKINDYIIPIGKTFKMNLNDWLK